MEFRYDQEADALSIIVSAGGIVARTRELDPGTLVDLDTLGNVLTIEVIRPARQLPIDELIDEFDLDPADAQLLRKVFGEAGKTFPFGKAEAVPA